MKQITQSIRPRPRLLVAVCLMMSCGANSALGWQQGATKPATEDKTARQTRILLENCLLQAEQVDYLTAKLASLTKLDANNKDLVAALEQQIAAQEKTIAALKAANASSDKIETISTKELASYQASLKAAQDEAAKWKSRAGFWKRVAGFGAVAMIGIGIGIGFVLAGK